MKRSSTKALPWWLGGLVVCGLSALATPLAGEEPRRETAEERRASLIDSLLENRPVADARQIRIDIEKRIVWIHHVGQVEWRYTHEGRPVYVQADRMMVEVRIPQEKPVPDPSPGEGEGRPAFDATWVRDFRFFADGNVRIEVPGRRVFLEADSFYYEHLTGRGVARSARLRASYEGLTGILTMYQAQAFSPGPYRKADDSSRTTEAVISVHAELLRMVDFDRYSGVGVEISTCDFAVPHYSLRAGAVTVHPISSSPEDGKGVEVPGKERAGIQGGSAAGGASASDAREGPPAADGGGGRQSGGEGSDASRGAAEPGLLQERDFMILPESTWLTLGGSRIVPFPVSQWDTRWQGNMPVRSIDGGSSSQFGIFGGVDWNLNYFVGLLPLESFKPIQVIQDEARMGFETDYMADRGFGFGPNASYGERPGRWGPWQLQLDAWNYYGEAQYYWIDDHGDEDTTTDLPVPRSDRYWGHIWHQQSIPHLGLINFEISKISDSAFLGEYFEEVEKEEKAQETLIYLRRNILDDLAVTGLYEVRLNDFETQTERLPEGRLYLLQQPVFRTGLYTDAYVQGAYLQYMYADDTGLDPRAYPRFDILNEWTYPLSLSPWLHLRPFALARYTPYGELLVPAAGSDERATFGAGVTASQQWSRVMHLEPGSLARLLLGVSELRHAIVPRVTYLNIFYNSIEPEDLIQVDSTDTVSSVESVTFSLRNEFFGRTPREGKPRKVRPVLRNRDVELESVAYDQRCLLDSNVSLSLFPRPDRDNEGDMASLLILDNTASLSSRLYLRGWFGVDINSGFQDQRSDISTSYEAIEDRLWVTLGDRYNRDLTNMVYGLLSYQLSEKWNVDAYCGYDFEDDEAEEISFSVSRIFHRFVLSVEYSLDVGEDRNQTVYFQFSPIELWRPKRGRSNRWF